MEVNIYAVRKQVHKAIVEYCTYEFRTLSSFIGILFFVSVAFPSPASFARRRLLPSKNEHKK